MAIKLKKFSIKSFSDWDQIRDLVKEQYPRLRFRKVDGSETEDSYKVKVTDGSKTKVIEIKKNPRKSAIENWVEGSKMKVENTARPELSEDKVEHYKEVSTNKVKHTKEQLELIELSKSDDMFDRSIAARKPSTPVDVLKKLADDHSWLVRASVAENPNTPVDILRKLAKESGFSGESVRSHLAKNPNTPVDILKKLINNEREDTLKYLAGNPSTPIDILKKLADNDDYTVRREVASNPSTPIEVLKDLSSDHDSGVRTLVNKNPNYKSDSTSKSSDNPNLESILGPAIDKATEKYGKSINSLYLDNILNEASKDQLSELKKCNPKNAITYLNSHIRKDGTSRGLDDDELNFYKLSEWEDYFDSL